MDCCRNISISGGLPSEYQTEQLLSSSCSKLGSLDDLFSSYNMEEEGGDVSLEWLSIFVEDCFSSSGNYSCLPPVGAAPPPNELQNTTTDIIATAAASMPPLLHSAEKTQQNTTSTTTSSLLQKKKKEKFVVPISKARSERKRGPVVTNKYSKTQQVTSSYWSHQAHIPLEQNFPLILTSSSSDPPLLQQAYWLADSELLILPMKEQDTGGGGGGGGSRRSRSEIYKGGKQEGGAEDEEEVVQEDEEDNKRRGSLEGSKGQQKQQQPRRCSHCLAQRTPQWRAGPLGPKTLCNACGVRYKSGRLLPEYRPAKSPTFVTCKHSNSHKKVMEMRMAI